MDGPRLRLDHALVARGLATTRSQAREAIGRGMVRVNGAVAMRAGQRVGLAARLEVEGERWVGRGALKLLAALDHYAIDPSGRRVLDVGASTGGFTEVLLSRGAAHVVALDVGHGQLAPTLREDPRVSVMEGANVRHLAEGDLPFAPELIVVDVSFVSLTQALVRPFAMAAPGATLIALIKPQFEVGRSEIGRGGLVRSAEAAEAAVDRVTAWIAGAGYDTRPPIVSPVTGGDGNREWLVAARRR